MGLPAVKIYTLPQKPKRKSNGSGPETGGLAFGKGVVDSEMIFLAQSFLTNPQTEKEYRERAIFEVLSKTGLRASELLQLDFENCIETPDGKKAFSFTGKGGKLRYCIPGEKAIQAVKEYHEKAGINATHFFWSLPNNREKGGRTKLHRSSLFRIVKSWHAKTGRGKVASPHSLRHSVLQKVFNQTGGLKASILAGHSNVDTTRRYYLEPAVDCTEMLEWSENTP